MKTTKKHFEYFKKRFLFYQKGFGLNGYKVAFKHEKIDGAYADIEINQAGHVALVRFSTEYDESRNVNKEEIDRSALHEACHLLVSKIRWLATCRYLDLSEIDDADEELVIKLVSILQSGIV